MTDLTLERIIEGLNTNDGWVHRAVRVLVEHPALGVLQRHKFQDYLAELESFGKIDPIGPARELCLPYAAVLLQVATSPAYDFKGKTFVLTGKLQNYTRTELTSKLEGFGAFVAGSVSRNTDILIVGSKPGSKFRAGQQYGTPMWNEDKLLENLKTPSKK